MLQTFFLSMLDEDLNINRTKLIGAITVSLNWVTSHDHLNLKGKKNEKCHQMIKWVDATYLKLDLESSKTGKVFTPCILSVIW